MVKKRGKLEVIYDILNLIKKNQNSIRFTPLLRHANLSTKRFREYLSELLEKGFVREVNTEKGKVITLTDRGFNYIERYRAITSFIEDFSL
jgi:predicted transcriptional regulator